MLGPQQESHPLFPERVNVGFMELVSANEIRLRVFERGAGETMACGTGACAVTVTCIFLSKAGKKDQELNVLVKGGKLKVTYRSDNHVFLKGPATHVFDGVIEIPEEILNK